MKHQTLILALLATFAGTALPTFAQDRPGIDRPIRVGMFKGTGTGNRFWHSNIHTSHTVMRDILTNPNAANLGDSLVVPPAGFTFYSMPIALNTAGTAECSGNGCGPTTVQIAEFVAALDTLDVMILSCVVDWGSRVANNAHREAFGNFWSRKGYVAIHAITDSYGTWAPLDTMNAARFRGHPAEQNGNVRRDSVFQDDPSWKYLNRGLFSNSTDTTFFEEWFYFTTSSATIRSKSFLKPTTKLNEASIADPGNQTAMGDHPHSWFRELPTGGRFFYTALGHRSQVWQTTRMFRRQVYNAILWSAKYDSLSSVAIRAPEAASRFTDVARVTSGASRLTVSVLQDGTHTVDIRSVDGRQIEKRNGSGRAQHEFSDLRGGVYAVKVTRGTQSTSQLVTVP